VAVTGGRRRPLAAAGLVAALFLACAPARPAAPLTEAEYAARLEAALDRLIARLRGAPQGRIKFAANLFLAHEVAIAAVPVGTLVRQVDALKAVGVRRLDINMGLSPWRAGDAEARDRYDALVRHIRAEGLELAINPAYARRHADVRTVDDWERAALPVFREIARRYAPDVFVVLHEPTTQEHRLGQAATPARWREFVRAAARAVKEASPRSRVGAGFLASERAHFDAILPLPEVDVVTLDVYALASLAAYNRMIEAARARGKPVYIEETWRPGFDPAAAGGGRVDLDQALSRGIGSARLAHLDRKWLEAMALYAAVQRLEAVTFFWTQAFFAYADGDASALDPAYNRRVIEAIDRGERTETYRTLAALVARHGGG
jgi:hypothetical protein